MSDPTIRSKSETGSRGYEPRGQGAGVAYPHPLGGEESSIVDPEVQGAYSAVQALGPRARRRLPALADGLADVCCLPEGKPVGPGERGHEERAGSESQGRATRFCFCCRSVGSSSPS